jgi:hypothetical protein
MAQPHPIPGTLSVTGTKILTVRATGDQIYNWDAATKAWKLTGPDAIFSGEGFTGKHFKTQNPTWQANDGSTVEGTTAANSPSPDDSIPWLLLTATNHTGTGILSGVTYIQRLNTKGGTPPATPGTKDAEEYRSHYSATYVFYGAGATTQPATKPSAK